MRLLIIEPHADGLLDLAIRASLGGHDVRLYERDYNPVRQPVGKGLIPRVSDWRPSMRWCDLCIVGGNGYCAPELDRWRRDGTPMIGGPSEAVEWESDRLLGMRAFEKKKIPVPPYRQCSSLDEAIAYVKKRGEGMAVKPCGDDVTDKTTSVVGKTAEEVLWRLDRWKKAGKRFPSGIICQDRIDGVEMAVGAWVGPGGFAPGWEENFEEKRLFAGGLGPNCGEAGTTLRLVAKSKLADKVLRPFEDELVAAGVIGNVDVNCIIDDNGEPWPLEWTVRFGYPAINIELALHDDDPIPFLQAVAADEKPPKRRMDAVAVGVVMALPPYPFGHEKPEEVVGVPIWGVTPGIASDLHLCAAQMADGQLASAGSYVLVSTGTGKTITEARRSAYRVLDRLTVPASPFWRIDIGTRLRGQIPRLQKHGYAMGLDYA